MDNFPQENNLGSLRVEKGDALGSLVPRHKKRWWLFFVVLIPALIIFAIYIVNAPSDAPVGDTLIIEPGDTLRSVSLKLKTDHLIRSRTVFEIFAILYGGEKHLRYADYFFEQRLPVYRIAERIIKGEHHMAPLSVTIPEGYTTEQIADTFTGKLPNFNKQNFLNLAAKSEGYLFPDTYFFNATDTEKEALSLMSENFKKKISPLLPQIAATGKSENTILVMASIIEGEAKGDADRAYISGILWKRLSIGMPLQVDTAPQTYKTKGLPQTPLNNPGILAIKAAISPMYSSYLYYLHDKDGNIHYARSFAEHKKNIQKYLK